MLLTLITSEMTLREKSVMQRLQGHMVFCETGPLSEGIKSWPELTYSTPRTARKALKRFQELVIQEGKCGSYLIKIAAAPDATSMLLASCSRKGRPRPKP